MSDNKEHIDDDGRAFYYINYNGIDYKCYFVDEDDNIVGLDDYTLEDEIYDLELDLKEYEEDENYEQCAIIRDKIIKLKIDNELK